MENPTQNKKTGPARMQEQSSAGVCYFVGIGDVGDRNFLQGFHLRVFLNAKQSQGGTTLLAPFRGGNIRASSHHITSSGFTNDKGGSHCKANSILRMVAGTE